MIWPQILWIIQVMLGDGESLEIFLCRIAAHLRVRRYFLWRSPAGRIGAKPQLRGISMDFHGKGHDLLGKGGSCNAQSILLSISIYRYPLNQYDWLLLQLVGLGKATSQQSCNNKTAPQSNLLVNGLQTGSQCPHMSWTIQRKEWSRVGARSNTPAPQVATEECVNWLYVSGKSWLDSWKMIPRYGTVIFQRSSKDLYYFTMFYSYIKYIQIPKFHGNGFNVANQPQHQIQKVKVEVIHGITLQKDCKICQVIVASQNVRQVSRTFIAACCTWKSLATNQQG